MRLAIGFAGVPPQIFDAFRRAESKLVEKDDIAIAESFRGTDSGYYPNPHANFFLREFAKLLREDRENKLADTGFAVAYVAAHPGAAEFAQRLFPAVLTIPVDWQLTGYNRTTWGQSLANLNSQFREAVILARQVIPTLKKELTEQDSRTPWLLPIKNFHSKVLVNRLKSINEAVRNGAKPDTLLREVRRDFEHAHPPQRISTYQRRCFVDDAGIEFHPPGRGPARLCSGSSWRASTFVPSKRTASFRRAIRSSIPLRLWPRWWRS